MRDAIAPLNRYIASPAQAKRIMPSFVPVRVCPSNLVTVFAFEEDYHLGVLGSFAHDRWLRGGWSSLEDRLRYTPSTVFATFPWPEPSAGQRDAVAVAARELLKTRGTLCREHDIGLTRLYNRFEEAPSRRCAPGTATSIVPSPGPTAGRCRPSRTPTTCFGA